MSGALRELAERVGIIPEYRDQTGHEMRVTRDDTRRALLDAMGFDVSSEDAIRASLDALDDEEWRTLIDPVRVVEVGSRAARSLEVRAPGARTSSGPWRLEIVAEHGESYVAEGPWRGDSTITLELPELPLGYHTLRISLTAGGDEWVNEQTLIIVPSRCVTPDELLGGGSAFSIITNLYTLRSATNWGVGDLSDLSQLAAWSGSIGADFLGVSPLHTLLNRGDQISPYSPVTRLFRNPLYIDPSRVPELAASDDVRARLESPEFCAELEALRETSDVRYAPVMAVKGLVLDALHRVFVERVLPSGDARAVAYDDYVRANDPSLSRFALWMALAERHGTNWHTWPAELRDFESDAVRAAESRVAERVGFHRWLQFEVDRQLGEAAGSARDAGMRIGLYQDLAIGTSHTGADTWAFPELFVMRASIGAPPDSYSATGQNWGLPPIDPRRLRRDAYRYFIAVIRNAFRNAGALRIDHVMGLLRLYWVPAGAAPARGAYVRYPFEDLLGILALESQRHRCLVIGEDLGTVPDEVRVALAAHDVLSYRVLLFERGAEGRFKPPIAYPEAAVATASTHDLPTLAGWWAGHDIAVRAEHGHLGANADVDAAMAQRIRDRGQLLAALATEELLPAGTPLDPSAVPTLTPPLAQALHAFLARSPCALFVAQPEDVFGVVEQANLPGTTTEHPNWRRKLPVTLDDMETDGRLQSLAARIARERATPK